MTCRLNKTDMRYDIVDKYNYMFLARPRRFGKSLLCNTFKGLLPMCFNNSHEVFIS